MSNIVEALFISTLDNERASCNVQDLRTGTDLMRYKGGGTMQQHSLQMLGDNYVISANIAKPLLHVWSINGQEQMSTIRYVVPGKVNALAVSTDSVYLVAGIQEMIYIWHLNSGRLLSTLSRHYQAINCIKFTSDGEHFVTAAKDGTVHVWGLTLAVNPINTGDVNDNAPLYSFNDHGLSVTDVHIGLGGLHAFMYTVSLDRCCKVYDLSNGSMLLSVVFPIALHSVIVNKMETSVYVGTCEGQVLVYHTEKVPRMKEYHLEEEESQAFIGHTAGTHITCLVLSVNGQQLISGGQDKQVCVWDVSSRQLLKSITQPGSITNLHVRLTSSSIFHPGPKGRKFFADNLKRMISPPEGDDEVLSLFIGEENVIRADSPPFDYNKYGDIEKELAKYLAAQSNKNADADDDEADAIAEDAEDSAVEDEEMPEANTVSTQAAKVRAKSAQLQQESKHLAAPSIIVDKKPQSKKNAKKWKKAQKK